MVALGRIHRRSKEQDGAIKLSVLQGASSALSDGSGSGQMLSNIWK